MTIYTLPQISAPAVSRLISAHTNVRKASSTGWSVGFYVTGYGAMVEVGYQDTNPVAVEVALKDVCDAVNNHPARKYEAKIEGQLVRVTARAETEEERMEKLAEESPFGVTLAEVRKVLAPGRFEYSANGAGYEVTREAAPNDRLVRVTFRDHSHTNYAPETGGRGAYSRNAVKSYARSLIQAGYSVQIGFEDGEDFVLVGQAGEFSKTPEQEAEEARGPLMALREVVEADSPFYTTRKAGNCSILVYSVLPGRALRGVEVFWQDGSYGSYVSYGRFGEARSEFHNVDLALRFIRSELDR